ncbi:unnamed protein product [Arabis nemorensis]|uniref:Uncharacterized protein n=1 Tax=Arabis nemorensis TaxID=586526 RepID=A0A565BCW4_9BRAS|nr:unnamed protein product [Arabis nemorensis]
MFPTGEQISFDLAVQDPSTMTPSPVSRDRGGISQAEFNGLNLILKPSVTNSNSTRTISILMSKLHSSATPISENRDTNLHETSAARVLGLVESRHGAQASRLNMTKAVVGIVAKLGKINDQKLSQWCLPFIEETSADDCCDSVMAAGKRSGIFKILETAKPPVKRS